MGRDQDINISVHLLKDLLIAVSLIHGGVIFLDVFDISWAGFYFWEVVGFISGILSLILIKFLAQDQTKYILSIPFLFCSIRWVGSWLFGNPMEIYTTTVSVLFYLPLLTNLGVQFGLRLWALVVWSILMGIAALSGHTRPILEGTPLDNWLISPVFMATVVVYALSFTRWRYNTHILEQKLEDERKLTIYLQAETAKQLGKRMEAISRLSGNVAHEFNNLLTIIIPLSISLQESLPAGELQDDSKDILEAGLRAEHLGQQLRSLTKTHTVIDEEVNLHRFVHTYLEAAKGSDHEFYTRLEADIQLDPNDILMVPAHQEDLKRLFDILIENAIEASSSMASKVKVRLTKKHILEVHPPLEQAHYGELAVLSIIDQGCGIEAQLLPYIFDPYISTHDIKGRGLGLTAAYVIALRSGGSIRVTSTINEGTTMTAYLPLIQVADSVVSDSSKAHTAVDLNQMRIILLDDEPTIAKTLSRMLNRKGASVTYFTDSAQAIEHLKDSLNVYDLIITDVLMPKYTGPEVVQHLKELGVKIPPILFMTGHVDDQAATTFQVAKENILFKPFTAESFISRVEYILGTKVK